MGDEHPIVGMIREKLSWGENGKELVAFYDRLSPLDPLKSPINDRGKLSYETMVNLMLGWVVDDYLGLHETECRLRYGKGRPPWRKIRM
jgi:hypothetical protein